MIRLNAGFSRKVGETNYGSRGACVNVELEVESKLVSDPDTLLGRPRPLDALPEAAIHVSSGEDRITGPRVTPSPAQWW